MNLFSAKELLVAKSFGQESQPEIFEVMSISHMIFNMKSVTYENVFNHLVGRTLEKKSVFSVTHFSPLKIRLWFGYDVIKFLTTIMILICLTLVQFCRFLSIFISVTVYVSI